MIKKVLCNVLLIILASSLVMGCANGPSEINFREPDITHQSIIASSECAPVMEYYLRKYIHDYGGEGNYTFILRIRVEDSDGIDSVLFGYSSDNITWSNLTMNREPENEYWYRGSILVLNISLNNRYQEFYVQYTANDTLGHKAVSEVCIHGVRYYPYTADFSGYPLYDTPDLWYIAGTSGHSITWKSEISPQTTIVAHSSIVKYVITKDDYVIESWFWENELTINVDGLRIGDHVYQIFVITLPNSRDSVTVHVVETPEEIPSGVSTGTVGPLTEITTAESDLLTPALIVGSVCIALSVVWMKRRNR